MIYEFITLETGEMVLRGEDESGKVWWIPQHPENSMYREYLRSIGQGEA